MSEENASGGRVLMKDGVWLVPPKEYTPQELKERERLRQEELKRLRRQRWELHANINVALYGHWWGRYSHRWADNHFELFNVVVFNYEYNPRPEDAEGWFPLFSEMMGFTPNYG